jgi:hypothetical protein
MADGRRTQLTRQIGEHLVAAMLGRRGYIASPFAGNVPLFDLLAADEGGFVVPVQVKAIDGPSWQFSAMTFLDVEVQPDRQVVRGLRAPPNPNLICVLLYLRDGGTDDAFVMRFLDLQALVAAEYKPRERPKNVGSLHCALWPKHVAPYRDRWDILDDAFALTRRAPAPISK